MSDGKESSVHGFRYFMRMSYCGAPFHGWQSQPNAVSVQSELERAMTMVLRCDDVKVVGAGRTDTGVNARAMVAHFDSVVDLSPRLDSLPRAINSITGPDIAVDSVWPVCQSMHARFSATARTYRYYALTRRSPFFNRLAWLAPSGLDFDLMNRAAAMLLDVSDFTSFAKLHTDVKTNICRVSRAEWIPVDAEENAWYFVIKADRFLRNMVRAVVGTLIEVGRHKLSLDGFRAVIEARDRAKAGTSMPAHALYLWQVDY